MPFDITDILEFDEIWTFVCSKKNKRWIWLVISRLKKQIIAYFIGNRSAESLHKLYDRIPKRYKNLYSYSDEWEAYSKVLNPKTHTSVPKQSGETSHIERFNNTLRQRLGKLVRKTLSFSKSDFMLDLTINTFIIDYNLSLNI